MEGGSLTTPPRMVGKLLVKETQTPPVRQTNGKVTFQVTIKFIGRKCGIRSERVRRPPLSGRFGIRQLLSMNGGPVSPRSLSLNNVLFVFLTRVNQLNTNFGTLSKLDGHGDGPPSLCMSCVGSGPTTMTVSIGNKLSLGKGSRVNTARKVRFGIFFGALPSGLFGLNAMTRSSTMNSGTKLRSNTAFGMNLSSTPKRLGIG